MTDRIEQNIRCSIGRAEQRNYHGMARAADFITFYPTFFKCCDLHVPGFGIKM